jgi:hypothetical protein
MPLTRANVTDLPSLMMQVRELSMFDFGARFSAATAPTIRGVNSTSEPRGFRTFEQDPVGTYIGNSPVNGGYHQLDDVQRVEILRGPQGTFYGAGALGGAIQNDRRPLVAGGARVTARMRCAWARRTSKPRRRMAGSPLSSRTEAKCPGALRSADRHHPTLTGGWPESRTRFERPCRDAVAGVIGYRVWRDAASRFC